MRFYLPLPRADALKIIRDGFSPPPESLRVDGSSGRIEVFRPMPTPWTDDDVTLVIEAPISPMEADTFVLMVCDSNSNHYLLSPSILNASRCRLATHRELVRAARASLDDWMLPDGGIVRSELIGNLVAGDDEEVGKYEREALAQEGFDWPGIKDRFIWTEVDELDDSPDGHGVCFFHGWIGFQKRHSPAAFLHDFPHQKPLGPFRVSLLSAKGMSALSVNKSDRKEIQNATRAAVAEFCVYNRGGDFQTLFVKVLING